MNACFHKEEVGETTRLILNIEKDTPLDLFALNMLERNRIDGLIPVQLFQFNQEHFLQYDITDKMTLSSRLTNTLKKEEVLSILNSIIHVFEEAEAYMLLERGLCLDWNYIFADENNQCSFLYLPVETDESMDKILFLQNIVEQIQEDYTERENYIYDIRNAFSRGAIKKMADLKDLLKKFHTLTRSVPDHTPLQEPVSSEPKPVSPEKPKGVSLGLKGVSLNIPGRENVSANSQQKAEFSFALPSQSGIPLNIPGKIMPSEKAKEEKETKKKADIKLPEFNLFGKKAAVKENLLGNETNPILQPETWEKKNEDMYESYEHTVLMETGKEEGTDGIAYAKQESAISAKLVRKSTLEEIVIQKEHFVIGSGKSADYCIVNNKTISRNHAYIQRRGETFYFADTHSSNGSYVNGMYAVPEKEMVLKANSVIRLSDEDFIFKLN